MRRNTKERQCEQRGKMRRGSFRKGRWCPPGIEERLMEKKDLWKNQQTARDFYLKRKLLTKVCGERSLWPLCDVPERRRQDSHVSGEHRETVAKKMSCLAKSFKMYSVFRDVFWW